ncbi:major facilitator superfamily transporter protein [Clarireedia jacksonii]
MASRIRTLLLIAANVLIPIAILTFASGFFPYKPFLSGLAQYESLEYGLPPDAPFDKVIFMVVDALRRYNGPLRSGLQAYMAVILYIRTFRGSSSHKGMFGTI